MEKIDWFVSLLVFNFLIALFGGFYGGYIADSQLETDDSPATLGGSFDIVTGFSSAPVWLNSILALQLVVLIYLGIATFAPGG